MNNLPTRKNRRSSLKFQGILKKKSKMNYTEWIKSTSVNIKEGFELFNVNKDSVEKSISDQLEQKELNLIEFWKDFGYIEEEIDKLREVYAMSVIKYKESQHSDKKNIKLLLNEIQQSEYKRVNG